MWDLAVLQPPSDLISPVGWPLIPVTTPDFLREQHVGDNNRRGLLLDYQHVNEPPGTRKSRRSPLTGRVWLRFCKVPIRLDEVRDRAKERGCDGVRFRRTFASSTRPTNTSRPLMLFPRGRLTLAPNREFIFTRIFQARLGLFLRARAAG